MFHLANWLQSQNIKFQANLTTQAAEQLPMEVVGRIHQMKDGDLLVMPRGNAIVVSQLDKSQSAPLTEQQAAPYIDQMLQYRKRVDLSNEAVTRLRAAGKLEYVGDFGKKAEAEPAAQPRSAVQSPTGQPQAAENEKAADAEGKGDAQKNTQQSK
jgi:hypothetical protein